MTKEEKIKEAWGSSINSYIKSNNSSLRNDGWSCVPPIDELSKYDIESEACHDLGVYDSVRSRYRPKSLRGIENNNGWVRIESEEDLPKKGTNCHFILKSGVRGIFVDIGDSEYLTLRNRGTYYQPIEKPNLPLY